MKKLLFLPFFLILLSSCVGSQKIPYDRVTIDLPNINPESISIAVWDQREIITSGKNRSQFIGHLISGSGGLSVLLTDSGNPVIDDIANSITTSFKKNGIEADMIITTPTDKEATILKKLKDSHKEKMLLIKCNKLYTDGWKQYVFYYDIDVSICNKSGVLIKKKSFIGIKGLGELKSKKEIKKRVPEGLKKLFEEIFKDEEINHALNDTFIENTMDFQQKEEVAQSKADKLRELKKLLDEGILTQEEFESEKKKILDKANL